MHMCLGMDMHVCGRVYGQACECVFKRVFMHGYTRMWQGVMYEYVHACLNVCFYACVRECVMYGYVHCACVHMCVQAHALSQVCGRVHIWVCELGMCAHMGLCMYVEDGILLRHNADVCIVSGLLRIMCSFFPPSLIRKSLILDKMQLQNKE